MYEIYIKTYSVYNTV